MKAEQLARFLQPIKTILANLITRSKVVSVDSSKAIYQVLSIVRGKPASEKIPMMQQYGFASVPPKDSEQIRVHISSDPDNPLIIASLHTDSQPLDQVPGDSALFDNRGQYIKIRPDRIEIFSPGQSINLITNGDININSQAATKVSSSTIELLAPFSITITSSAAVNINASSVNIDAPITNLGVGGQRIARLGDEVTVNPITGTGTITSAGVNTSI